MYKTIRHGENSLQYTILPQNDDIRMDGKLTSASSSSSNSSISNTGNCHRNKRSGGVKNKSFYAYLGLLFVCTVIIGAILIPFLVSTECLPNPSDWFLKTKLTFNSGHNNNNSNNNNNNNNNNKIKQIHKLYNNNNNNYSTISSTTLKPTPTLKDNNNIKININNQSTDSTINKAYPNKNNIGLNDDIPTTILTETTTTNTATKIQNDFNYNNFIINKNKQILNKNNNNMNNHNIYKINNDIKLSNHNKIDVKNNEILISNQHQQSKEHIISNIKFDDIIHTTNKPFEIIITTPINSNSLSPVTENNNNYDDISTETTIVNKNLNNRKLLPPLPPIPVTKKPIILPVLAKTNSIIKENGIIITEHNQSKNWIKSHWPFIDPSTYFQWTGYKSEDSVLLPAILGITLIGLILILTLCLVARNKRIIVASVRKRNRNDIDETGEDNATLLTTANLSDADDE